MSSTQDISKEDIAVIHPGENLVEYLEAFGWSQRDLARRTGITPKTISEICSGKAPITPLTALAFEKVLSRPAHFWLALQRHFDEAVARRDYLAKARGWGAWAKTFPLREMRRLRYTVPNGRSDTDVVLNYFGVASPESWTSVWQASNVAYRQTTKFETRVEAVAAWVREVELEAREIELAPFSDRALAQSLDKLRSLTRERAEEILEPVQQICASAGVAVVLVAALPKTGISGCARWVGGRAIVGLTLRHKTDDQFWFTFFHELGHVLLHRSKRSFVLDNAASTLDDRVVDPEMQMFEAEASQFAADALVPPEPLSEFLRAGVFTNESILEFSDRVGVGPGIVVGRLQHDGILAAYQGNSFKQRLNWAFFNED